jgi:tRNA-dihydrouridine synthase B
MIGRACYGRPWLPGQVAHFLATGERRADPLLSAQLAILLGHLEDMLSHYGNDTGVRNARKHVAWYSRGLPGSAEFRSHVNRLADPAAVRRAIAEFYDPLLDQAAA